MDKYNYKKLVCDISAVEIINQHFMVRTKN